MTLSAQSFKAVPLSPQLALAIQMGQALAYAEDVYTALAKAACALTGASWGAVWLQKHESIEQVAAYIDGQHIQPRVDKEHIIQIITRATIYVGTQDVDGVAMRWVGVPLLWEGHGVGVLAVLVQHVESMPTVTEGLTVLAGFASTGAATQADQQNWLEERQTWYEEMNHRIDRVRLIAMNEMAAAVSHQLNNPLTTILADTELLLDNAELAQAHPSLHAVHRAGKRAAEVVHRLMAVSQPDKMEGVPQRIDVIMTLSQVLSLMEGYMRVEQIRVVQSFPPSVPRVWVVPNSLDDVWLNLLMNARDAVIGLDDPHIGIVVRYVPAQSVVEVVVWDNGKGIPSDDYEKIFTPFYTTKHAAERIGLGLHVSKNIVEGAGGTLTVSQHKQGGAQFTVHLPVEREK